MAMRVRVFQRQIRGIANVVSGSAVASTLNRSLAEEVTRLRDRFGDVPRLVSVMVGHSGASESYVATKQRAAKELGIDFQVMRFEETCSQQDIAQALEKLQHRKDVDGLMVELPVPSHINASNLARAIALERDVDGLNPGSLGKLANLRQVSPKNASCTALSILELVKNIKPSLQVCHSKTKDLPDMCRQADVLVVAVGKPNFIKGSWIKPGATVIDAGINVVQDEAAEHGHRIVGDVCFDEVKQVAGAITPVPDGVGPVTVAMIMRNTVHNAKRRLEGSSLD